MCYGGCNCKRCNPPDIPSPLTQTQNEAMGAASMLTNPMTHEQAHLYELSRLVHALRATIEQRDGQIEKLAAFILAHVPGEPSKSEGAVDTAIRIIEQQAQEIERIQKELDHHVRQRCYAIEENLKLKKEIERLKRELNDEVQTSLKYLGERNEKIKQLAAMQADVAAACGELMVSLEESPPGSLVARLVIANRVLRSNLAAMTAERDEAKEISDWFGGLVKRASIGTKGTPSLRAYIEQTEAKLSARELSLEGARAEVTALEQQLATAQAQVKELEAERTLLQHRFDDAMDAIDKLQRP